MFHDTILSEKGHSVIHSAKTVGRAIDGRRASSYESAAVNLDWGDVFGSCRLHPRWMPFHSDDQSRPLLGCSGWLAATAQTLGAQADL